MIAMHRQIHAIVTALLLILVVGSQALAAGPQPQQWSGSGPFATGLGNRVITALAVSPDGRTVYAGTGSSTVFSYVYTTPAVATTAATAVTGTDAILNGTANANGNSSTVSFEYGPTVAYGTAVTAIPTTITGTSSTAISAVVTGLACGTAYHFRTVGNNSSGTAFGQDQDFITSACPVNGVCGSNNGGTFTAVPTANLCTSGIASAVTGSGPWSWSCAGTSGGTNASCTAAIDITGPAITLSTLSDGAVTNNATLNVSGTVADVSGIKSLTVNSQAVTVAGNGSFTWPVTLVNGTNIITTVAIDNANNQTIDTRTITLERHPSKIGIFTDGYWYLDLNQSWAWEGTPSDKLGIFGIGITGAIPVAGDWNSDGKSEIGVFIDGIWYLDMNGNGQWDGEGIDVRGVFGIGVPNARPVVGDWTGDGKTKIGIYADGIWYLDANQSWDWNGEGTDIRGVFGNGLPNAKPVTGDWNGDGITKIGVYSEGNWYLDKNRNWVWDGVPTDTYGVFGIGLPNVVPVTGDWNGDGITKIGVYSDGNWYMDTNNSWAWDGVPADTYGAFGTGLPNVTPVVGNW
jgi:hypothetical protein